VLDGEHESAYLRCQLNHVVAVHLGKYRQHMCCSADE
jgi:hypothetical protein